MSRTQAESRISNSAIRNLNIFRVNGGQSVVEYAVLIAVVVAALLTMNVYIRRSVQANPRAIEDQINAEAVEPPGQPPP